MKILIATDAWYPQMNGVVRTFSSLINKLENWGHEVKIIHPDMFKTFPMPTYPEIRLAIVNQKTINTEIEEFKPDAVHIVAEGTIGFSVRNFCVKNKLPFTTSYTTKFPEYIYARFFVPEAFTYSLVRWFHSAATRIMVATESIKRELEDRAFHNIVLWTRGVDTELFHPGYEKVVKSDKPILMYTGRLAVEKNIEAFLDLEYDAKKVVVGTGPDIDELIKKYPDVDFVGKKTGKELAAYYASADCFVFPSMTDTFGLVMIEAMACGVPVAAFPVPGPLDVVTDSGAGVLDWELKTAIDEALKIDKENCRKHALKYSWDTVAELFLKYLAPVKREK